MKPSLLSRRGSPAENGSVQRLVWRQPDDRSLRLAIVARNGVTWTPHRETGLPAASPQAVVVFNGALWVLGHGRWEEATNDIWTSSDGAHWQRVLSAAPWMARTDPGIGFARGRMWVIAGAGFRDVWSSSDGRRWIRSDVELPGPPRTANFIVSHRDALWVFGGKTGGAGGTGFWDGIYMLR